VIAGVLGLLVAWLIPKGGGKPADNVTPTPTAARGVTAVEERLSDVSPGVSFRVIDGVRVFLVRTGDKVAGFEGVSTAPGDGPIHWCPSGQLFQASSNGPWWGNDGKVVFWGAPRNLNRITVIVSAGRVTIVPHEIVPGSPGEPTPSPPVPHPRPPSCAANQTVG